MPAFHDQSGAVQQLPLAVTMYAEAAQAGMTLPQWLASNYQTDTARYGSVMSQLMESEGIFVRPNREVGIRPSTMAEMFNGPGTQAGVIVKDGVPASRILFPAVFLQLLEDKLVANLTMTADAFEQLIGYDEGINGDRYEQPVVSLTKAEAGRSQGTSQLANVPSMLTITTSDKAYRIPSFGIGLEVADQALKATSIDFVAMSLARQAAVERNERAQGYMLQLYNGDIDNNDSSLATLGYVDASSSFDAAAVTGNNFITQKAWMKYLMKNGTKRTITHIVTDIDTAMKIETRAGKPVITGDDPNSTRIDTQFNLMNPTWAKNPQIFLTQDSAWPASTLMGLDKQWAIRRVRNLAASYQAIEQFVMRRSTQMRVDFGEHVNRLYPEAFAGMTLS
jgi:hypothetical protein